MHFAFTWKHRDGSTIEFAQGSWNSDDPEKAEWLKTQCAVSKPCPVIPVAIRFWLRQHCELIEFRGISYRD